jgi:hypothetical protein
MTIIAGRQFTAALSGAVVVWPVPAGAQQPATPVIPKESSLDPAFAKAMEAVNAKLKDPHSAHYGEMVRKVGPNLNGKPAEVVCGSVNHGYGGNRSFVSFIGDGATFIAEVTPQSEESPKSSIDVSASSNGSEWGRRD